jgi:hypothetical protein
MSTAKTDVTLRSALTSLLAERRLLRELGQKAFVFRLRFDTEKAAAAEASIAAVVYEPLDLPRAEKPADPHLTQACANLPFLLVQKEHPEFLDTPARIFDGFVSVVPGVSVTSWNAALQQRLLDLTAPLDTTLSKMLAEV